MLNDSTLAIMELAGQGFCCSQILVLLSLQGMGLDDPPLTRAMAGLCNGMGDCSGPCGILSGGACVLALHTAQGFAGDTADERLPLLLEAFRDWFHDATTPYGGITCGVIMGGDCRTPDPSRCGVLLAESHQRINAILIEHGFDPAIPKGE